MNQLNRRTFLGQAAAATAGVTILSRTAGAVSANDKIGLASVGVGGMGAADLGQISKHPNVEVLGLCDVDSNRLASAAKLHPKAQTFADWRVMMEKLGSSIQAVNVATPDHTHAPASMTAIQFGKHVYCQKPLTHDVFEARALNEAAKRHGVVTQMGIQVHSQSAYRTAVRVIQEGTIGKVREVHSWSGKRWGYDGPKPTTSAVPSHLNWDLWLGTAPFRAYAKDHYHPGNWRKWVDFGCGTMGDMSIHILDPVFAALALSAPIGMQSLLSEKPPADSFAMRNQVRYEMRPSKFTTGEFSLTWSDGGIFPDHSEWPMGGRKLPSQGSMFIGEKGYMLLPHVSQPVLLPTGEFANFKPEADQSHWHQWVDACLGNGKASADFSYAGPLTEFVLLGVIANRFPGARLEFDAEGVAITNHDQAHSMIRRAYRDGFEVAGL